MKGKYYDRLGEMEVFTQVVDSQNFTHAAKRLGMAPSSISKLITRMEARLGVRLINRTTRNVALTQEGELYYHRAIRILADVDETEGLVFSKQKKLQGKVRITCSSGFAYHQIIPLLPEFIKHHPHIQIILYSTDQVIDIVEERYDIAIRVGQLDDSSLIARKLCESKRLLVASPAYIKQHGMPKHPNELIKHICLNFYAHSILNDWPFKKSGKKAQLTVHGPFSADNGESLRMMALAGGGIARLSAFMVQDDINTHKLVPVLQDWNPGEWHPVYVLHSGHLSERVRCVLDFLFKRLNAHYVIE